MSAQKSKTVISVLCISAVIILFLPLFINYFSITDFIKTLLSAKALRIGLVTSVQAFLSALLCFFFSIAPAYYITHNDNRFSRLLDATFFIPFFFPVVATAIAFHIIFGFLPFSMNYSLGAVLTAHVFYNTPVFIRYISSAWKRIDPSLFDNTALETGNMYLAFFNTVLPHILKTAARSFFIVFTFCFTSFGIILSLGNLGLTNFEIAIYSRLHTSVDISGAISLAVIQLLILGTINLYITRTESHELDEFATAVSRKSGRLSYLFSFAFLIFEGIVIATSLGSSVLFSVYRRKNYFLEIFSDSFNRTFPVIKGLYHSLTVSVLAGLCVTLLTFLLLKKNSKLTEFFITSLYTISMAMISIALIIITIGTGISPIIILIIGFTVITLPLSYSFMQQHIGAFLPAVLEQAQCDGADMFKSFRYIEFPMLLPILSANFLQITAVIFGEFTLSYMFQAGKNFPLISTVNYSVHARRLLGETYAINTVSTLIIVIIFLSSTFITRQGCEGACSRRDEADEPSPEQPDPKGPPIKISDR